MIIDQRAAVVAGQHHDRQPCHSREHPDPTDQPRGAGRQRDAAAEAGEGWLRQKQQPALDQQQHAVDVAGPFAKARVRLQQHAIGHRLRHKPRGGDIVGLDALGPVLGGLAGLGGQNRAGHAARQQQNCRDAQASSRHKQMQHLEQNRYRYQHQRCVDDQWVKACEIRHDMLLVVRRNQLSRRVVSNS